MGSGQNRKKKVVEQDLVVEAGFRLHQARAMALALRLKLNFPRGNMQDFKVGLMCV